MKTIMTIWEFLAILLALSFAVRILMLARGFIPAL
ncbi:MAG: hypothetical protein BMS9Abin23_0375 [Thermodesulfobacteriota bacterium]|nr:MAG: hypothetical protein BMS9Abin23_0375 [Thermodesulfobacteriota bacterium]